MEELIEQLRKRYAGEWLGIRVTEYENWRPRKGVLLVHSTDKEAFHREIRERQLTRLCYTYGGPMIPPGYEVLL